MYILFFFILIFYLIIKIGKTLFQFLNNVAMAIYTSSAAKDHLHLKHNCFENFTARKPFQ